MTGRQSDTWLTLGAENLSPETMNCERCQIELEDFLYGELTEPLAAEVRQHLAGCMVCEAERERLESENALFAEFYEQTAIDPAAGSWEAIRSRIVAEPIRQISEEKSFWWQKMFGWLLVPSLVRQAGLAILLIAVSVVATMWLMRRDDKDKPVVALKPSPTATVTPQSVAPESSPTPQNELAKVEPVRPKPQAPREVFPARQLSDNELLAQQLVRAEREYQSAIKLLDRAVAKRRTEIEPEAFKKYESSLALIDSSIAQSKRALRELPNDTAAGQFLLAAYARKVELMQEIALQ